MKYALTYVLAFFYCMQAICQQKEIRYIELKATIDVLGNINIQTYNMPLQKQGYSNDSATSKAITRILNKNRNAIYVINELNTLGWELITAAYIMPDSENRPTGSFIIYYMKCRK